MESKELTDYKFDTAKLDWGILPIDKLEWLIKGLCWVRSLYTTQRGIVSNQAPETFRPVRNIRTDLFPSRTLADINYVLSLGAEKYAVESWKLLSNHKRRYYSACIRHIVSWLKREGVDVQSNKSHLIHAICCLIFLAELD